MQSSYLVTWPRTPIEPQSTHLAAVQAHIRALVCTRPMHKSFQCTTAWTLDGTYYLIHTISNTCGRPRFIQYAVDTSLSNTSSCLDVKRPSAKPLPRGVITSGSRAVSPARRAQAINLRRSAAAPACCRPSIALPPIPAYDHDQSR